MSADDTASDLIQATACMRALRLANRVLRAENELLAERVCFLEARLARASEMFPDDVTMPLPTGMFFRKQI